MNNKFPQIHLIYNRYKKASPDKHVDEDRLLKNVEKHVLCLARAFEITSKEVQRSPKAVAAHWYQRTSKKCGRALFVTVSGKHVAVNRKNGKGQPLSCLFIKGLPISGGHQGFMNTICDIQHCGGYYG